MVHRKVLDEQGRNQWWEKRMSYLAKYRQTLMSTYANTTTSSHAKAET